MSDELSLLLNLGFIVLILIGSPFLLLLGKGSKGHVPGVAMAYAPGDGPNDRVRDPGDC